MKKALLVIDAQDDFIGGSGVRKSLIMKMTLMN